MKKLILILTCCIYALQIHAQVKFNAETKAYIDFDTSIIAFKHALVIDGKGGMPKPLQTVIIKNGKIDWIGDDASANVPSQALTLDLTGKTLMPGLVMLHEHLYHSAFSFDPVYLHVQQLPVTFPRMYLAAGATTIRTCGSVEPYADLRIKKDIDAGKMVGPFMELTAPYLEGEDTRFPQMNELKNPAEAIAFVNYWADQGFTSFKAYMNIKKEVLKAAIETAHKRGLKVTGHLCSITYREAAEIGIDQLEHGFSVSTDFVAGKKPNECVSGLLVNRSLAGLSGDNETLKSLIRFLVEKKVKITSTLQVREGSTTLQPIPDAATLEAMTPEARDYYFKRLIGRFGVKAPTLSDSAFIAYAKMEKQFYDAGGLLTVGTDPTGNGGVLAGYGNWRNIELLVEAAGFTPLEAIKIATINGAMALEMDKTTGSIEKGKDADLIVIDGDPSKKISDIRKVVWVFKDGTGYNSKRIFDSVKGRVGFH